MEIKCPSGLSGSIRKPKVKDINLLRNAGGKQSIRAYTSLIRACWESTLDKGPYQWDGDPMAVPWDDVLSGDRFFILLKMREALFGEKYKFSTVCRSCRGSYQWEVNTKEDLPIKPLDEVGLLVMKGDKLFRGTTKDGREVVWKMSTGRLETAIDDAEEPMLRLMLPRIHTLAGQAQPKQIREELLEMDHDVFDHLQALMEEHECGVETSFYSTCPKCSTQNIADLPFDRGFFFPHSTR